MSQIRDKEIPRLEATKGQKEAEIKKLQTELNRVCVCVCVSRLRGKEGCIMHHCISCSLQAEEKLSGFRTSLDQVRGLQPRVSHTSQLRKDLEELDTKIGSEESKLGGSDSSRSHLLVNRELQEARMKA